jgi:hypothetical protein
VGGTKIGETFNRDWARRFRIFKHTTPAQLHDVVGNEPFNSFHKFLFVRDPIKRFKSATQFLYQVVKEERDWVLSAYSNEYLDEINNLKSVSDLVSSKLFRFIIDKAPASCNESELCFKPQSLYYCYLYDAYRESSSFYKLENLDESLNSLVDLSIVTHSEIEKSQVMIRRRNQSKKLLPSELRESDIKLLKDVFSEDYSLFAYDPTGYDRNISIPLGL